MAFVTCFSLCLIQYIQ